MATIHSYTAATTIDATADFLLIDPASSGTYKKISRNTLLGITGSPADISSVQTLTNKVLDNTNSLTIKDGSLTLQNTSSTTKQAIFDVSTVTAGQTRTVKIPDSNTTLPVVSQIVTISGPTAARTYTFPDAAATIVGTATTQTLTNKTITDSGSVLGGVTMTLGSDASGDMYYRNSSGVLTRVAAGSLNQVLTMGASSVPAWGTGTSQITLLKANSGTDTSAGATNVDTFAISGLTAKDNLVVYITVSSITQNTGAITLLNNTDSIITARISAGAAVVAGNSTTSSTIIRQEQSAATAVTSVTMYGTQTTAGGSAAGAVDITTNAFTTAWTGSWTIALRHNGVTAGGTFRWSWSLYKIAGQ